MKRSFLLTLGGIGLASWAVSRLLRDDFSFAGKSVLITGGSRGLGLDIARRIAAEGGRVALLARDEDELAAWYAQWRLPCMQKMPGCVRVRKLVSVAGWAKHAIVYEFTSVAARNDQFLDHERDNPKMEAWTDQVVRKLVHAPGSPNLARRIWPA